MGFYYKLLTNRPHILILAVILFSGSCIIAGYTFNKLPDFSDPTIGFESRGTIIGEKLTAWKNLLSDNKLLVANPKELLLAAEIEKINNKQLQRRKNINQLKLNKIQNKYQLNQSQIKNDENFINIERRDRTKYVKNSSILTHDQNENVLGNEEKLHGQFKKKLVNKPDKIEGFFCDSPRFEYAHFVIKKRNQGKNSSLLNIEDFLAICDMEQRLTMVKGFDFICERKITSQKCCRAWSFPNYISLLAGKNNCFELNDTDIRMIKQLIVKCFPYYQSLKLNRNCAESKCQVPENCTTHNAVFNIFHFLSNFDLIKDSSAFLKETIIFLPIAKSSKALTFYENIDKSILNNGRVEIVGMDLGLKNILFDKYLVEDAFLIVGGALFVIICMWLYTSSLFITTMTIAAIFFSLGISYFLYTLVFKINFFPFMNVMAVVIIIGIGADDAFIFMKIWNTSLSDYTTHSQTKNLQVYLTLCKTLEHAGVSMFVTSFTTSAAFFASIISSITAIRCFGIFAGTLVLVNYFLMMTWLPAIVSIRGKTNLEFRLFKFKNIWRPTLKLIQCLENNIIKLVNMYSIFTIICLSIIGIYSSFVVLCKPQLQLPDTVDFKLFVKEHPFEMYDTKYKNRFWFERVHSSNSNYKLPLRFVWGVLPFDSGNYLDPLSRGNLQLDDTFNISSPDSQVWLLGFCKILKEQSFYLSSNGALLQNCFIENLITWMSRRCMDEMTNVNRYPCCEKSVFPYSAEVFDICLQESISSLYETPRKYFVPGVAGPKFSRRNMSSRNNNRVIFPVKSIVIEYESSQDFTMSYIEMSEFVNNVNLWFTKTLLTAPKGLKNGWFTSDLEFYDLQDSLARGTLLSIIVSIGVALIVLFVVTLNLLISFYAILTISFTIFTSIAVLVLLGWKLNVLESVAVSTVIGLSIDFSLHYGVHYKLCNEPNRQSATQFSLSRMIRPTLMAALTTIVAGTFMVFSSVLAYIQIGVFLIVVMTISWIYSTFFLMSLLRLFGPQNNFGQIKSSIIFCKNHHKKTVTKRLDIDSDRQKQNENLISISEV
ncbi:protein dispatched isoform X2 [Culicoides brevitarsis]|uniref:protein dispatched isoform X2 n=1 Tax=Culicoides brevitarsis TaxID=469753 RepID=UPI00307BFAAC